MLFLGPLGSFGGVRYREPLKLNVLVVLSNRLRGEVNLGLIDGGSRW